MKNVIIDKIYEYMNYNNFCFYLYGSSATNYLGGRDIDVIVVTQDIDNVLYYTIEIPFNNNNKICNTYIVSQNIFLNDIIAFEYGGYYSTKFALCFKKVFEKGTTIDPPFEFWLNQCRLYYYQNSNKTHLNPEMLSEFTHFNIYKYSPTFARSLSKYLIDNYQRKVLNDYLAAEILPKYALFRRADQKDIIYKTYYNNCKKSFYLFWNEYNKHKTNCHLWDIKTFNKIITSFTEINLSLIESYFKEYV